MRKKTKEEFIKESKEKHGDKYNYSKVDYVNSATKVCIICPEHGEFWQMPSSHLRGKGCTECGQIEMWNKRGRMTTEKIVEKFTFVHGHKYDYSKVDYMGCKINVCIICPKHGEFWQTPSNHLKDRGCPKCGVENRSEKNTLTKEEFVKKARSKHGDKYDYSKVDYVGAHTKVCIICSEHGEFWQIPYSHLTRSGCPKCGNEKIRENKFSTKEVFIKKAIEVHSDKYDYSKVNYVGAQSKVCIICPKHGGFWQVSSQHLSGQGCPKCGNENKGGYCRSTKEEFIKKANKVHGDKYDYSKVDYVNDRTKVCIICPEHGKFEQRPHNHIVGQGCPKCNLSHLERDVMKCLDDIGITYDYQKRFNWLGRQSLDFYLPDYNMGIECQGKQHFFPIDFAGKGVGWACKQFNKAISLDKRKKALCEKHGVKLLYFGNVPNYDTFLGEVVHDDVRYLIDYLSKHRKKNDS